MWILCWIENRLDQWEAVPAMYLIMPDRFSNGNPNNDDVDMPRNAAWTALRCTPDTEETFKA